jgi:hypothetical protein
MVSLDREIKIHSSSGSHQFFVLTAFSFFTQKMNSNEFAIEKCEYEKDPVRYRKILQWNYFSTANYNSPGKLYSLSIF